MHKPGIVNTQIGTQGPMGRCDHRESKAKDGRATEPGLEFERGRYVEGGWRNGRKSQTRMRKGHPGS